VKFHVYKDRKNQYRWAFRAKNGKILADSSEGYKNKGDCMSAIQSIILACVMADDESKIISDE
jgi:uncharacterized protein YegP (UPF0339 family)